jgi:Fanconi anemia group M protein
MPFLDIFSKKKEKEEKIRIIIDNREKNSLVAPYLMEQGFEIEFKQLPVGDYLVNGTAIERKTVSDFKSSIINKRIISQLLELKQYGKHLLLIEGILAEDLYSGGIHENAFRGFLLSVALEFQVPIIFTRDEKDSAKYISVLARKKEKGEVALRASKIALTDKEQVQFILEGFPNVGPAKAKKLIEKFGSLKNVFNASGEDLKEILGKRTEEFKKLLDYIS